MSACGTKRTCKPRLANVCFEGKNRCDSDVMRCLLMTRSGHARSIGAGADGAALLRAAGG